MVRLMAKAARFQIALFKVEIRFLGISLGI